jgi:uncharacterized membrane protein YGL010W
MPKLLHNWLADYAESHQNPTNKWIHRICVPLIFLSIYWLLFCIPFPYPKSMYLNWGSISYLFALIFWFRLSFKIGLVFFFIGILLAISTLFLWVWYLHRLDYLLVKFASMIFALAWIGQFVGHKIEGKKPSFFKDIQLLLIGPIWVVWKKIK